MTKGEKHKRRKMKETYLSANIETAYIKAWYDEAAKRLLCDKYILAWIIISVIDEYKDRILKKTVTFTVIWRFKTTIIRDTTM